MMFSELSIPKWMRVRVPLRRRLERRAVSLEQQALPVRDRQAPFDLVAGVLAEHQRRVVGDG